MQPSRDTIVELIGALAMLTEASGKLNAHIDCAFRFPDLRPAEPDDFSAHFVYRDNLIKAEEGFLLADDYTGSVDKARELFAQLLPTCNWFGGQGRLSSEEPLYGYAIFDGPDLSEDDPDPIGEGEHDLEPVAFLIAAFNALLYRRGR